MEGPSIKLLLSGTSLLRDLSVIRRILLGQYSILRPKRIEPPSLLWIVLENELHATVHLIREEPAVFTQVRLLFGPLVL